MREMAFFAALILISISGFSQRERRLVIDADTLSPVKVGTYGIFTKDNQTYVRNSTGIDFKLVTEFPYEIVRSSMGSLTINAYAFTQIFPIKYNNYQESNHTPNLVIVRDSVTISLDPASNGTRTGHYKIAYLGVSNGLQVADGTCRLNFDRPIYYVDEGGTFMSTYFSHDHPVGQFVIKPFSMIYIETKTVNDVIRWYLSNSDFDYL